MRGADAQRLLHRRKQGDELLAQRSEQAIRIGELAFLHARAQRLDQFATGRDADIGADQHGFEFVEQGFVELGMTPEQIADIAIEHAFG